MKTTNSLLLIFCVFLGNILIAQENKCKVQGGVEFGLGKYFLSNNHIGEKVFYNIYPFAEFTLNNNNPLQRTIPKEEFSKYIRYKNLSIASFILHLEKKHYTSHLELSNYFAFSWFRGFLSNSVYFQNYGPMTIYRDTKYRLAYQLSIINTHGYSWNISENIKVKLLGGLKISPFNILFNDDYIWQRTGTSPNLFYEVTNQIEHFFWNIQPMVSPVIDIGIEKQFSEKKYGYLKIRYDHSINVPFQNEKYLLQGKAISLNLGMKWQ